ncbi:MAG: GAF domain-containing protein [Armatimonadota bacterium]
MEPALLEALRESTDDLAEEWRRAAGTGWHESGPSGSGLLGNAARFLRALWAHLGDPSDGESLALVAGGDQGEVPAALQCLKSVLRERVISCCPSQVESATAALRAIEAAIDRHISVSLYRGGEESAWAWDRGVHDPVGQAGIAAAPRAADASAQGEAVGVSEVAGQMRELRAVRELAALAVSGKSTQEIIEASVDIIARALEADFVQVFLYDENSGVLRLAGDKDLPEAVRRRISKQEVRPGAPGIAGRTALTRKPVIVEDLLTDPLAEHARKEVQETGARSMLSAPAIGNEGLVGVFQVVTRRRRSFTDEEVGLLRTMGHQLALVIERSRADEESRRRTRELECLNVIGRAAAEPIELEEVLESALRAGLPALGGDGGVVYLLDRDAGVLRRAAVVGTLGHKVMPAMAQVTPGEGLTGRVVVTGVGEAVNDTIEDGDLVLPGTAQLGVMAVASAPLRGREGIVGALTIGATRKNAFSSDAVHLLEAIGAQLGVAVENARLYREAMAAERYAKNILATATFA